MNANEIATLIKDGWRKYIEMDERSSSARDYVYASQWRACTRRMFYDMTAPEALPPWDANTLARFKRGKDRERDMMIDLERVGSLVRPGFDRIGGQEPFVLSDRKGRKTISGKVDARIKFYGEPNAYPVEAKSWSPNITASLETFEDVLAGKWTRSGAFQTLAYLLGAKEPIGFLLLDRPGLPELIPVELEAHYEEAEDFWRKAEEATAAVHGEADIPDFIDDPSECKQCPFFGSVCNPPIRDNSRMAVITDEEELAKIGRYVELKKALEVAGLDEFRALDKQLKEELRGVEHAIAGDAIITGKWGKQSVTLLPAEVKAEWDAIKREYTRTDPHGKFTLRIEAVDREEVTST